MLSQRTIVVVGLTIVVDATVVVVGLTIVVDATVVVEFVVGTTVVVVGTTVDVVGLTIVVDATTVVTVVVGTTVDAVVVVPFPTSEMVVDAPLSWWSTMCPVESPAMLGLKIRVKTHVLPGAIAMKPPEPMHVRLNSPKAGLSPVASTKVASTFPVLVTVTSRFVTVPIGWLPKSILSRSTETASTRRSALTGKVRIRSAVSVTETRSLKRPDTSMVNTTSIRQDSPGAMGFVQVP